MKNATTNQGYSAKNEAELFDAMCAQGFDSELVAGYGQWQKAGRQVRKGESGTQIKRIVIKQVKNKKTGKLEDKKLMKTLTVFFLEQTDEMTAEQIAEAKKPLSKKMGIRWNGSEEVSAPTTLLEETLTEMFGVLEGEK